MENTLFSMKDAAKILKVSDRRVRQFVERGMLKARKIGGAYIIDGEALGDFIRTWKPRKKEVK